MRSSLPPRRAWQRMLSGRRLDLLDPHPGDIAIEDIAHGLARVARWNGQTSGRHVFSVAQHSLLVEAIFAQDGAADRQGSLTALLHDAAEYVVGDLISPFKTVLDDTYKAVEHRVLAAIHARFELGERPDVREAVKHADRIAARLEATYLAGFAEAEATLYFGPPPPSADRWIEALEPLPADEVKSRLLARFHGLGGA